jgi:hypothetical protein
MEITNEYIVIWICGNALVALGGELREEQFYER